MQLHRWIFCVVIFTVAFSSFREASGACDTKCRDRKYFRLLTADGLKCTELFSLDCFNCRWPGSGCFDDGIAVPDGDKCFRTQSAQLKRYGDSCTQKCAAVEPEANPFAGAGDWIPFDKVNVCPLYDQPTIPSGSGE